MKFPNPKSPNPKIRIRSFLLLGLSLSIIVWVLVLFLSSSSSKKRPPLQIQHACHATRYPDACLAQSPALTDSDQIISWALSVSARRLKTARSMVRGDCGDLLTSSGRRIHAAGDALSRGSLKDARAFASAALVYQYDCWSALKYLNGTSKMSAMSFLNDSLLVSTSNALSMLAALLHYGPDTASWAPPRTERSGFWDPAELGLGFGLELELELGLPAADATVCKSGCDFGTVQAAVEAAPEGRKRHVIHIKEGVYQETVRVGFDKTNLVWVGDGIGKTVITASLNTGVMGITTYHTATVGVDGDGFMATGITIQNTAGPGAHQAVAFRSSSDLSFLQNCEFVGNQDTLYPHSLRQLYKSCRILGNVDFIFGGASAFFHNCTILVRPRPNHPPKGETNAITAHGRTDPAQSTGFVFFACLVNGTHEYMKLYYSKPSAHRNYLGRPWKDYSRTVFLNSVLEALILPAGWLPWKGKPNLKTLYYGEYRNTGPGADLSHRVPWSSRIPAHRIAAYSPNNFIQADQYSFKIKGS